MLLIHISDQHGAEIRRMAFHARSTLPTFARFLLERALLELSDSPSRPRPLNLALAQIDPLAAQIMHLPLAEIFEDELRAQARTRKLGVAELARLLLVSALEPSADQQQAALIFSASASHADRVSPRLAWLRMLSKQMDSDFALFDPCIHAQHLLCIHEHRAFNDFYPATACSTESQRI